MPRRYNDQKNIGDLGKEMLKNFEDSISGILAKNGFNNKIYDSAEVMKDKEIAWLVSNSEDFGSFIWACRASMLDANKKRSDYLKRYVG